MITINEYHKDLETSLFSFLREDTKYAAAIQLESKHFTSPTRWAIFQCLQELGKKDLKYTTNYLRSYFTRVGITPEDDWNQVFKSSRSADSVAKDNISLDTGIKQALYFASELKELLTRKDYCAWLESNIKNSYNPTIPMRDIVKTHSMQVAQVQKGLSDDVDPSVVGIMERAAKMTTARHFSSGLDSIDKHVQGLRHGHLWVLTAPYKARKTTVALNMVARQLREGRSVAYIALEDEDFSYVDRLASIMYNIPTELTETGIEIADEKMRQEVKDAKAMIMSMPLRVYDGRYGVHDWRSIPSLIASDKLRFGDLDVVVIDYIQAWSTDYQALQEVVPMLLRTCSEEKVGMIALSQMSNNDIRMNRSGGAGTEGVLLTKASGDIGAACHVGIEIYKDQDVDDEIMVTLKVARKGPGNKRTWCSLNPSSGKILSQDFKARLLKHWDNREYEQKELPLGD